MAPEEAETFRSHRWVEDALTLRRCDDAGKDLQRTVVDPERYHTLLERVVAQRHR